MHFTRIRCGQIFCIKWRPLVKNSAVTVGVRHIKFWEQAGSGFTSKRGVFGKAGKLDTMLCIEFGANGEVVYVSLVLKSFL